MKTLVTGRRCILHLVRIILPISLVLSSLGIGKDRDSLLKRLVASLLQCRG